MIGGVCLGDLLAWAAAYIEIGKFIPLTGPGMVIAAFALVGIWFVLNNISSQLKMSDKCIVQSAIGISKMYASWKNKYCTRVEYK